MNFVDSVATQPRLREAVYEVVSRARGTTVVVVGCKDGKHRSLVVSTVVADLLKLLGFAVAVCQLHLAQALLLCDARRWVGTHRANSQSTVLRERVRPTVFVRISFAQCVAHDAHPSSAEVFGPPSFEK